MAKSRPRTYRAGSTDVPSVTECLKFLENDVWMNAFIARNGRKELDTLRNNAAVLGTRIHAIARRIAGNREYVPEAEMIPYANAIREFYDTHVRRVIATELCLVSEKERVGGTLDAYVEMQTGERAVVDFKCKRAAGVTDVNRVQTAGYALLLREHGYVVNRRIVVRLHTSEEKKGKWYARSATAHMEEVDAFRACVVLWHFKHSKTLEKSA